VRDYRISESTDDPRSDLHLPESSLSALKNHDWKPIRIGFIAIAAALVGVPLFCMVVYGYHRLLLWYIPKLLMIKDTGEPNVGIIGDSLIVLSFVVLIVSLVLSSAAIRKQSQELQLSRTIMGIRKEEEEEVTRQRATLEVMENVRMLGQNIVLASDQQESWGVTSRNEIVRSNLSRLIEYALEILVDITRGKSSLLKGFAQDVINENKGRISGLDLSERDLQHAELQEANLEKTNLEKTSLQKANLKGANLKQANIMEANLSGADLSHADLEAADLRKAVLKDAKLKGAKLTTANFWQADLESADFESASIESANFWRANLENANLSETCLDKANLWSATLTKAKLYSTSLTAADLRISNLVEANLSEAVLDDTNFIGADLRRANLRNASLQGCNLWVANFRGGRSLRGQPEGCRSQKSQAGGSRPPRCRFSGSPTRRDPIGRSQPQGGQPQRCSRTDP